MKAKGPSTTNRRITSPLKRSTHEVQCIFSFFPLAAPLPGGALAADPQVDIKTNVGTIRLELYPEKAPKTVENFLQYVKDGHYNGTIFHRVIDGFMIQGGGFDQAYKQKPTREPIQNEAKNGLKNDVGTRRHGAHERAAFGDRAVLHQRQEQRLPQLSGARTAGATRCSARWCRAWTSSTKIAKTPTGAAGPSAATCRGSR